MDHQFPEAARAAVNQAIVSRLDLPATDNPDGWPVPPLPPAAWHDLPAADHGLEAAAAEYFGNA